MSAASSRNPAIVPQSASGLTHSPGSLLLSPSGHDRLGAPQGSVRPSEGFFEPDGLEYVQGPESLSAKSVGPEGLDEVDAQAAGAWEDVEERLLRVRCPSGAGLRLGPGDRFETLEILPVGTLLTAPPAPAWAQVPGWICVETEMFHGQTVRGWVEDSLVEDADGAV